MILVPVSRDACVVTIDKLTPPSVGRAVEDAERMLGRVVTPANHQRKRCGERMCQHRDWTESRQWVGPKLRGSKRILSQPSVARKNFLHRRKPVPPIMIADAIDD